MFPRLRTAHLKQWATAVQNFQGPDKIQCNKATFDKMSHAWTTYSIIHEKDVENSVNLVRDASLLGYLKTELTKARWIHRAFAAEEDARVSDDEDDSDWPDRPVNGGSADTDTSEDDSVADQPV